MKKFLKIIGNIFVILSLMFIVKKIITYDVTYNILFNEKNIIMFIVCCLIYGIYVIVCAWPWKNVVQILANKKINFKTAAKVEAKANLMKYLPGNIFQYVGKNELALICDISHVSVASATVIDVLTNLITVFIIIVLFYMKGLIDVITFYGIKLFYLIFIGIILIIILTILIIVFRKKIGSYLKTYINLFKLKGIFIILKNILFHFIKNLCNALLFVLVFTNIVGGTLTVGIIPVLGAFVLSWFIGFIMIGAPGGIGVREAVIVFLLGNTMNEQDILLAIVIYRFVSTIGDIIGFVVALIIEKVMNLSITKK